MAEKWTPEKLGRVLYEQFEEPDCLNCPAKLVAGCHAQPDPKAELCTLFAETLNDMNGKPLARNIDLLPEKIEL